MRFRLCIVPHTHWDREWYMTFQQFRHRLVRLGDMLLGLLEEDPLFRQFTFDGQTVVLEDYLEIRPENEGRLRELVRQGRILVGPWYILPDEFLVSGESFVRNLLFGRRVAERFGPRMMVGYLPDQFGHSAAVPKYLKGAGMDCAVVWRGVGRDIASSEFIWQGDDGTEVMGIYLARSYGNAASLPLGESELADRLKAIAEPLLSFAQTPYLLLMNGSDHLEPQKGLPQVLNAIREDLPYDCEMTSLADYAEKIKSAVSRDALPRHRGEFRSHAGAEILPGTLSARVGLKQASDRLEVLLPQVAEPLAAIASLEGVLYPYSYLNLAWKNLLLNQPHDSICGCSIDQVHREMELRFAAAEEITRGVIADAAAHIASLLPGSAEGGKGTVVFNTEEAARSAPAEAETQDGGRRLFLASDVPGMGYKWFSRAEVEGAAPAGTARVRVSRQSIENEYLRVSVNRDGSLGIHDKIAGVSFDNCCSFEDGGDAGDEYNYSPPRRDAVVRRAASAVSRMVEDAGIRGSLEVELKMRLPEGLDSKRRGRSREKRTVVIRNRVSLAAGVPRADFSTRIENTVKDHRFRVLFPVPWTVSEAVAFNHHGTVRRPARAPEAAKGLSERPISTYPNLGYVAVENGDYTACIGNIGLREYEITPEGAIAVTLLRCVGWLSRDDLAWRRGHAGPGLETPEAQVQGSHVFEYCFSTGKGWGPVSEAFSFRNPLLCVPGRDSHGGGRQPSKQAFASLSPEGLRIAALKKAEHGEGVILRVFSLRTDETQGNLHFHRRAASVRLVSILEEDEGPAVIDVKGGVKFKIRPNEIVSFRVSF